MYSIFKAYVIFDIHCTCYKRKGSITFESHSSGWLHDALHVEENTLDDVAHGHDMLKKAYIL